mgnify:CR=1 FL=1
MFFFIAASCVIMLMPDGTPSTVPSFTLPDGRVVRLEAVTYGKKHEYRSGSLFIEKLQKMLPYGMRDMLGPRVQVMRSSYSEDLLIPWVSVDSGPSGRSPNYDSIRIVADTGEGLSVNSRSGGDEINGRRFMRPNVRIFPRRDQSFKLIGKIDKQEFTLTVPNPLWPLTVPEWTAVEIPASVETGGFTITLKKGQLYRRRDGVSFSPFFGVAENGETRDDWFDFTWQLADATGNQGYALFTNEPVWRVDAKAYRKAGARWATNEYHEFKLESMPASGEIQEHFIIQTVQGVDLRALWIGGPGHFEISNRVVTLADPYVPGMGNGFSSSSSGGSRVDWKVEWKRDKHWIMIEAPYRPGDLRLSAFVRDATGKEAKVRRSGSMGAGGFYSHFIEVEKVKDGEKYTVRLAPQEPLQAEFFIAPADLPVK